MTAKHFGFSAIDHDEIIEESARRLCAAALSMQLGVSVQTAYKNLNGCKIGSYWLRLAHTVMRDAKSGFQGSAMDKTALN